MEGIGRHESVSKSVELAYDHFDHREEKFEELRELAGYNDRGICWFAALTMGIQALYPEREQASIIDDLKSATFELPAEKGLKIFQAMREDGVDVSPFYKEGELKPLGSKKEGESFGFVEKHSESYAALLNEILKDNNLGVKMGFNKSLTNFLDTTSFRNDIQRAMEAKKAVLLPINYTGKDGVVHPHIIMVGGIYPNGLKISDSNVPNPLYIPNETITMLISDGFIDSELDSLVQYNPAVGIITLEKAP